MLQKKELETSAFWPDAYSALQESWIHRSKFSHIKKIWRYEEDSGSTEQERSNENPDLEVQFTVLEVNALYWLWKIVIAIILNLFVLTAH